MNWLSEPLRLVLLITLCTLLWSLESVVPLYNFKNGRLRHALPNVALTLILLLTNLALSFTSALTAEFAIRSGVGLANRKNCRSGFPEHQGAERNAAVAVVSGDEIHGNFVRLSVWFMSRG